ncbi:MAG TPA: ATP-binding protein, partial [Solirubrobacteraceae bacterium]|nr:ATP-binding protein [Solirubrobacteraceae bacterium]
MAHGSPAPVMVGREDELALVTALLERGRERGDALLLQGEPGIGKSALAAVAADRARGLGATVLTTTGVPSEADLPYACLHQLLAPVMDQAAGLSGGHRSALDHALGAAEDVRAVDTYRAGLAVLDLLGDVAERAPVVVVAEDAHWLDAPTCDVLAFVARRIEADPVAMLITSRDEVPPSLRGAGLPTRRLAPLTADAADALLHALDPGLPPAARRRVLDQAAGNPLGLVELLSEAARGEDSASSARLPLTTRLERTFAARFADLPDETRMAV